MKKREAREFYTQRRDELSDAERAKADDLMLIHFQKIDLPPVHHLLTYWPIEENNEPDTHLFSDYLEFINPAIKFLYPKSDFDKIEMEAIEVNADTGFQKTSRNIREPVDGIVTDPTVIDMVFVPLIIFDTAGCRVGYGKGFYDKYVKRCRPDCIKIGFCYFEPVDEIEDTHEFDVSLNLCFTPNTIYVF